MWSDKESDNDYLNFGEVSQLTVDILKADDMLPISIGVFGNWGSGKSSLLRLIENDLKNDPAEWIIINFDAWLYQGYDDARAALLEVIAKTLTESASYDSSLAKKARVLLSRVDGFRAMGLFAEGAAMASGIPTGGLLARSVGALGGMKDGIQDEDEYQELTDTAKDVKQASDSLLTPQTKSTPPQQIDEFREEYNEILKELDKPLIVVIDNLDRCLPANAIHTLEALRLFLFLTNTAFIIAADEEMIRLSVGEYFKGASDRHQIDYLDKLIQIPIRVPKAGILEIRSYLFMLYAIDNGIPDQDLKNLREGLEDALQRSWKDDPISRQDALALVGAGPGDPLENAFTRADRIAPLLANSPIIHGNPRIVKRLLNVVKMRSQIATRRSMPLDEALITKLVIFERCAGIKATTDFYRMVDAEHGTPAVLQKLEDNNGAMPEEAPQSWKENPTTESFLREWAQLEPRLSTVDLRPAIYLSRETMPIGAYISGLSPIGRDVLEALINTQNTSSPSAQKSVVRLPHEEHVPVMEGVINHLRQISDWSRRPNGFPGACLLARQSDSAANALLHFLDDLHFDEGLPAWLNTALKDESWYTEK